MSRENEDLRSHKTRIENIQKELERMWKEFKDLQMDILMLQLENGERSIADLSQTEVYDLISYKDIGTLQQYLDASVTNEPILGDDHDITKASDDVAPEGRGNMKPSDNVDDEMKKPYQGESSKSGGVDNDA
ncbi:unnamed protein product [Eruca vesicaria subsp. sativa]|uniref:Uncharacterized protein n=1 Tax=Eruca vesicaria subsp. sativa TaxID=29727 RepID=A0ABC8LFH7_ERUVS|nr:unnamed protein product [Eruca vesicaria subsp. sativa]